MKLAHCRSLLVLLSALTLPAAGCGQGAGDEKAPPAAERIVAVEVEEVSPGRVEDWLDLPGRIDPFKDVTVSAEVGGLLEVLRVEEGEAVKQGQKLAVIDRENLELKERQALLFLEQAGLGVGQSRIGLEQAAAAVESAAARSRQAEASFAQAEEMERKARAMMEEGTRDHERGQALFEERLAPRSRLDELEMVLEAAAADLASAREGVKAAEAGIAVAAAGEKTAAAGLRAADEQIRLAQSREKTSEANLEEARLFLRKSTIRSPIEGFVDSTFSEEGELVKAQDPLLRIVQTRPAKAVFHLPEQDVSYLSGGMRAEVTVEALSPRPREGEVSLIGVTSDPSTSTYRLEVDLPNEDGTLRPGMLARLRLLRREIDGTMTAPVFAVVSEGRRSFVFLYAEGVARRREVSTGIVDGERVEIVSGLEEAEFLIVKGQRGLEDGQKVSLP
jgi:RND family efflux transporter MFP subunit